MKTASVCISQTAWGTGGGSTNGVNGGIRMSSTSNMIRLMPLGQRLEDS